MSAPLLVVHLVHGTWGRGVWPVIREELGWPPKAQSAYWFEEGSKFRSEVARRLEDVEFEFRQFTWSGSNSFGARTFAADALRDYLKLELERQNTRHLLVGHSHAGNVIFETLTRPDCVAEAKKIAGVLTLATPYLAMETEPSDFNLILHRLLPFILGGYALGLIVFSALMNYRDMAGWLAATAIAYGVGIARLRPGSWRRWPRELLFWAAAVVAAGCVGHAALPWFANDYPPDSFFANLLLGLAPAAAVVLGVATFGLLVAARAAGSTSPGTFLLRDLIRALCAVFAAVTLLVASITIAVQQTATASSYWIFLAFWPYLSLGLAQFGNDGVPREAVLNLLRAQDKETEKVELPCELHAMRLASDEATLAIVASQLVRAISTSTRRIFDWIFSWSAPVQIAVTALLLIFGACIGYVQAAEWTSGWLQFGVGTVLGAFEMVVVLFFGSLMAAPLLLLLATLSYALVGLAVGTELFQLLPAVRITCESLPRGPSEKLKLTLLWPDPSERANLPLRHSMYDLPSVQARVAHWLREMAAKKSDLTPPP